ncbi:LysR family transcriptional regulator [Massilia phosphatilytica]|jgi:DNA-binding transcriptional LysR family regulator|nr:LysR family transcriptional regulator [Massilia phosphatilytica]
MLVLDDVRFFQILVRAGSMVAAARELNVSPPAITQRLQQIEAKHGVRLIDRSTRRMQLTDEGELMYEKGALICAEADALMDMLAARTGAVTGHLRVSAPFGFSRRHLAPLVADFHTRHPSLKISLTVTDNPSLHDAGTADVMFHIGELHDSSMVRYTIAPNDRLLCAAPKYVRRRGVPAVPEDLAAHECITLRENNEDVSLWKFTRGKASRHVRIEPSLMSNDGEIVCQWAMQGKGIIVRSEWDVADALKSGKLVRLLPDWELAPAGVVALVPQSKGMSARVKAFLDFVHGHFSPQPPWRR